MSYWYEAKIDEIDVDGEEINIYAGYDDSGNRYVTVKKKDILEAIDKAYPIQTTTP